MKTETHAETRSYVDAGGTVHLPVVSWQDVKRPGDHFHCEPLRSTISASSCVQRQRAFRRPKIVGDAVRFGPRTHLAKCGDCSVGRHVEKMVGRRVERRRPEQRRAIAPKAPTPKPTKQAKPTKPPAPRRAIRPEPAPPPELMPALLELVRLYGAARVREAVEVVTRRRRRLAIAAEETARAAFDGLVDPHLLLVVAIYAYRNVTGRSFPDVAADFAVDVAVVVRAVDAVEARMRRPGDPSSHVDRVSRVMRDLRSFHGSGDPT